MQYATAYVRTTQPKTQAEERGQLEILDGLTPMISKRSNDPMGKHVFYINNLITTIRYAHTHSQKLNLKMPRWVRGKRKMESVTTSYFSCYILYIKEYLIFLLY